MMVIIMVVVMIVIVRAHGRCVAENGAGGNQFGSGLGVPTPPDRHSTPQFHADLEIGTPPASCRLTTRSLDHGAL
jgi:hypothetical protein